MFPLLKFLQDFATLPKSLFDLPRVDRVVNELAGSGCTKPDKWAFLIAPSPGIVFLLPNLLLAAFHDDEERR